MNSVKNCRIVLDSLNNTYLPGQTVNGHVEYFLDTPRKLKGIKVVLRGYAETKWSTNDDSQIKKSDDTQAETVVVHTASEEYFKITNNIFGSKNGAEATISPGIYRYNFTCTLPSSLPSSFEGKYGFVRYTVAIIREESWGSEQDISVLFTVINFFDLNMDPKCKEPVTINLKKTMCCLWCKSGPVNLEVSLPASGYYPGQSIPVDVSCENGSTAVISEINIRLRKVCTFHFETPSKKKKDKSEKIIKMSFGNVLANSTKNFNQTFQLPAALSSNALANCGIIDIHYNLQIELVAIGCHFIKEKEIPFTIGNAPQVGYVPPQPAVNFNQSNNEHTPLFASAPEESPIGNIKQPPFNPVINFPSLISMPQPYSSPSNPPYPSVGNLPYPPAANPPYPPAANPPYPSATNPPYPSAANSPSSFTGISSTPWNPHSPYPPVDKKY